MSRWSLRLLVSVPLVALTIGLTAVAAWGIDRLVHLDQVNRNVTLDGVAIGGLSVAELDSVLEELAAERATDITVINAPGYTIEVTNAEAGIKLDVDATRAAALQTGRDDGPVALVSSWLAAMQDPIEIQPVFTVDLEVAAETVRAAPGWVRIPPTEPSFTAASGEYVVAAGRNGEFIDPAAAAETLAAEVAFGQHPFTVDVPWSPMAPQFDESHVARALEAAAELTDTDLAVRINGRSAHLGRTTLTRWIDSVIGSDGLVPVFNEERVAESLERLLDGYTSRFPQPVYLVEDKQVTYGLDGPPAMECCDSGAAELLYAEAQRGGNALVFLPTKPVEDDGGTARVETLGITELVSEFTTNHACCEARVTNIHRIADTVRGTIIQPGERFSVNGFVGERTIEKGFVPAGAIQQGHFKDDVGGGVSQFATTLFNAAFFAGLEFDDYQSHTIYLSRYPYGREATLNYPDVDLALVNNTPYGVLIWTAYDETSITVEMYSTQYWEVEQTDQSSWRSGACRSVETFRTRTGPDGEVLEDSVKARYRPGEGLDCNGRPTPKPRG